MTTLTQHFDDIAPDFVRAYPLPAVKEIGFENKMHDLLDMASTLRRITGALGSKGIGKSFQVSRAVEWFDAREQGRWDMDNAYVRQRVLVLTHLRHDDYYAVLTTILRQLDRREPILVRGKKKDASELRERICELLEQRHYAAIVLDEAESVNAKAVEAVRDIVALCTDRAKIRGGANDNKALGIGMLMVGSHGAQSVIKGMVEFGHRLGRLIELPRLTIAQAVAVLDTWLPAAAELQGDARLEWRETVRLEVCRDRGTTILHLETVVREYARRLDRARHLTDASGWADVPIHLAMFTKVAQAIEPPPQDETKDVKTRRARGQ